MMIRIDNILVSMQCTKKIGQVFPRANRASSSFQISHSSEAKQKDYHYEHAFWMLCQCTLGSLQGLVITIMFFSG